MTITAYRSPGPAGSDGFAELVRAEWDKFRTVRGWVISIVVAALLMLLIGLFGTGSSGSSCSPGPGLAKSGAACLPYVPTGPGGEAVTDSFYFVRQPVVGNSSITVRVTRLTGRYGPGAGPANPGAPGSNLHSGIQPWSKAGIIITPSTKQGSAYAAMMVTGSHGVRLQYDYTHDVAGLPGKVSAHPRWLRLTRSGDTITGYDSADGSHWIRVGTLDLPGLPSIVQIGLFAASPAYAQLTSSFGGSTGNVGPSLATGVFDHVSLSGGRRGGTWAGDNVGNQDAYGAATGQLETFRQASGKFTVTGSGDVAPIVTGPATGLPSTTVEQHLVGAFAALVAVIVVAAMFITAEYRRGLIRVTLAASPRRGRVLAAKAIVIGLVTFIMGLVTAAIAVPFGVKLSRDQGLYVLPVSWLTEVRVVMGTAALLAVGAVLALAVGTILRRSAVAVTAVIVGIVLTYILAVASVLPLGAAEWLLRVTPAAGFAIQQSMPQYPQVGAAYTPTAGYFPLAPWAGFAVLCGYAVLAMALAIFLLRRRDA